MLDALKADLLHLLKSKLMYITNGTIPDIEPDVAFLITRVAKNNVDNYKKIRRRISYLNQTVDNVSIIGVYIITYFFTCVNTSYDVHPNMHRYTEEVMSMVYGILHC